MSHAPSREWDAAAYHRVSSPQVAWGTAVLGRLPLRGDEDAVDLGCGSGRLTSMLLDRLPHGRVVGVDLSAQMLREARGHLAAAGHRFAALQADLVALPLAGGSADVVFSTATFHWVADHDRLFAEIARVLRAGGRLAAQCGGVGNIDRVHAHARRVAADGDWGGAFVTWRDPWEFATPEVTAGRLERAGLVVDHTGIVEAPAAFESGAAFAEFVAVVVLRPWLGRLGDDAARRRFVEAVTAAAGDDDPRHTVDYRRLDIAAHRAG